MPTGTSAELQNMTPVRYRVIGSLLFHQRHEESDNKDYELFNLILSHVGGVARAPQERIRYQCAKDNSSLSDSCVCAR